MRITLLVFISSFISLVALGQNFPYGQVDNAALQMKKYDKDTSAHALVLQEYGSSRITTVSTDEGIRLVYKYHVKIKIFDNKGFDSGTVAIKVRNNESNSQQDQVSNITGTTYYTDENGLVQKADLDTKKIYTTRDYKYESTMKFAMPALHNGCVIEYQYDIVTPFWLTHFRPWEFQSDIPKVYSEYEAFIPGHFTYNGLLRGPLKLTKNKSEIEHDCFTMMQAKSDCSDLTYGMSDVPAFIEEDYMTASKNFRSAIEFELVEYIDPYNGVKSKATKEWRDIDNDLRSDQSFGSQLKKKDFMKDRIAPAIAGKTTDLDKAKAIYAYLQKWFKYNNYIGIYSADGIKKAYETHSGSIADINIALVAALNGAGIKTEAVLLSTRDNGTVNELYPALGDFNYVIAKANIGDVTYLLDATDPLLSFGMLPIKCLNDKGRVFSFDKPSYWIDLNIAQKETSTYSFDLTLQENGKLKGKMLIFSAGYGAYEKRQEIKKFNTVDEYVENINEKSPRLKILKSDLSNIDSLDKPISETYEVEIDVIDKKNLNSMSFSPFFFKRITTNPFKLADRTYPVDRGMASDARIVLNVHLPDKYVIENPPQNVAFTMPNNGGRFMTSFENDSNSFTFSHIIQFTKSIYDPNEYPYLKELYNKIILSEKADMLFKKKI